MKQLIQFITVLAIALSSLHAMGQDIVDMEDFVAKGYAGSLTDQQIAQFTANWTEQDWNQFYAALARSSGIDNPDVVAAKLVAEDRALAGSGAVALQHSAEIPRTHTYDSSMRSAHYWETAQYGCDNDPDTDYQYKFTVSAATVLNMKWYSTNGWIGLIIGGTSGNLKAFGQAPIQKCVSEIRAYVW